MIRKKTPAGKPEPKLPFRSHRNKSIVLPADNHNKILNVLRHLLLLCLLACFTHINIAQKLFQPGTPNPQKGTLYFYWGWNQDWFTRSDITFTGADYDFTLKNVRAKDRQTRFALDPYFKLNKFSIPQYNFRLGFYLKNNLDISFGIDHMKYVVQSPQTVRISGRIENSQTGFDGTYSDEDIEIEEGFLEFEHTDGLNYLNIELRRSVSLFRAGVLHVQALAGGGMGCILPRTNTTLLNKERYDEFHLAGYGIGAVAGISAGFFNIGFVQSELKSGFIHLPDVRTTMDEADRAHQRFFYAQLNLVFGCRIPLHRKTAARTHHG